MNPLKFWWRKWLSVARAIGNFQAQLFLSLFYLAIFLPIALLIRLLADPFNLRKKLKSNFHQWQHEASDLEGARKQY